MQGNTLAQALLADMYKLGRGVPRDFVLAYAMYNAAAARGSGVSAKSRDSLAENFMTQAQIEKAQRVRGHAAPAGRAPGGGLVPIANDPLSANMRFDLVAQAYTLLPLKYSLEKS